KMLTNTGEDTDLSKWRDKLQKHLPKETQAYFLENNKETHLEFPIKQYPTKIKSLNLEKTPHFKGKLTGVKGQYLLFENGTVFNVRNNEGYVVSLSV
ncbi:MAG TPA: DUF2797 domain-containing protein, partial [Lutibacter sp.]|nr:DUF2797 domain-containing protein [Lutibacter sp.]